MLKTEYFSSPPPLLSARRSITSRRYNYPRALRSESYTRTVSPDNFGVTKRSKSKLNRARNTGFDIREGIYEANLALLDYVSERGHAPSRDRILAKTYELDLKWYSCCFEGVALYTVGYVRRHGQCRFIYIARNFDHVDQGLISLAGLLLFWTIIETEFEAGSKSIDLGGVSTGEKTQENGIDRFKRQFGGEITKVYSYEGVVFAAAGFVRSILRKAK